ncbi:DUF4168 domain-containing protein [Thiomicrospira pelophila]|uniref:DUF4168 domain-containing protein n=1 Tax=Thiomicrospira pelophila TaxID=934 RepID=UPI00056EC8CC|nr:DUF4168 domain-containing protein [Thiomicrospira pelophila]
MFKLFLSIVVLSSSIFATNAMSMPQQQQVPSAEKVEQFAVSLIKVEEIKQGLQAELAKRPKNEVNDQLLQQVNAQFQEQAIHVISAEGLSVNEYSGMINLMQQDKQFLAMVKQKVEEVQSK